MPSRQLPQSDEGRNIALTRAKDKNDSLPVGTEVLNAATVVSLDAMQPNFYSKMTLRDVALRNQGNSTIDTDTKKNKAKMFISHFFQTFLNGVDRGVFPEADKTYYHLDLNSNSVPVIKTEADIISWGNHIITGDPLRTAAGGTAMAMPSLTEFTTVFNAFKTANNSQSNYKDAYNAALKAVADLRTDTDKLIVRIWNEVETYYSGEEISNRRKNAREWGVVYINMPEEMSMTGTITDTSNNPVEGAEVRFPALGVVAISNSFGVYNMPVVEAGTYDVEVTKPGYTAQTIPGIVIETGIITTLNIQLNATTGTIIANVMGQGQPLANATVTINELMLSTQTNESGQAVINNVIAGNWNVVASKSGFQPQTQQATIEAGIIITLSFDLQ